MAKIIKKDVLDKKSPEGGLSSKGYIRPIVQSGKVLNKGVLSASDEAKRIIDDARSEAEGIVAKAQELRKEVDAIRERAKEKGLEIGKEAGLFEFNEKLMKLEDVRERFFKEAEGEVIKLVMEIAEKVIGKLVQDHKGIIQEVVRQALERAIGDRITVKLNPEDYKELKEKGKDFSDIIDRTRRLSFKEDESIARGGCVVETEVGTIDARIETQLNAIKKTMGKV